MLPVCEELSMGFLTGTIGPDTTVDANTDIRANSPRFTLEVMKANMPVVDVLRAIAKKKNANPVQISLAWLLAQKT